MGAEDEVVAGSIWSSKNNSVPVTVLTVVDGFVMYRYRKYRPGVMPVDEWLSLMRRRGNTPSVQSTAIATTGRISRGR